MGKYFGTDGFRGEANVDLTVEHAFEVGRFIGWYFGREHKCKVVIGKDTRRSSYMFEYALVAGLTASGADAYLLHVTTTPSVSYVVRTEDFDCGIMISASHNPFYDNGIKLINDKGEQMQEYVIDEIEKYLGPGEVVHLRADSMVQLRKPDEGMQICSFLWVYYGFPTSCYEGRNVEEVRFTSGLKMGQKDTSEVDCACGIPDSGVGMALGYAEGKGIPYHRAIAKYTPTWPRSFTPSNQAMRSLVAKMKLIPNRAMLDDKRLLFCDDSIVRGTQLRDNVKVLYDYGAKEVHMRIACPPLIYACPFVGFTASKNALELITRQIIKELEGDENKNLDKYATTGSPEYEKMVSIIAERFGLTSLKFNTLETLIEAIGLPKCQVCTHCFDGSSHF